MNADSRLSRSERDLRSLFTERHVAALGTLDEAGAPSLSMVPFAVLIGHADEVGGELALILHVSELAAHTRQMRQEPRVALLVTASEDAADTPQALPRVSLSATASFVEPGTDRHARASAAYLARFPQSELMTQLPDFQFVALMPTAVRHVAGFGAARSVDPADLARVLRDLRPGA
ncbi:pyridoxamine 5'-phosphate oxidase family protein [Leptothrix sp. BB-4]